MTYLPQAHLYQAHNEAYFDLQEQLIHLRGLNFLIKNWLWNHSLTKGFNYEKGVVNDDGFEWLQSAHGDGLWWYRRRNTSQEWKKCDSSLIGEMFRPESSLFER